MIGAIQAPALSRDELVSLGGWEALKEGRGLQGSGAVKSYAWDDPTLRGEIRIAAARLFPRVIFDHNGVSETRCNCAQGRRGVVCAHVIALCLGSQVRNVDDEDAPAEHPSSRAEVETEIEPAPPPLSSDPHGTSLEFRVCLPPNLASVAKRDAIVVKIEVILGSNLVPAEKLDGSLPYNVSPAHAAIGGLIRSWCHGKLRSILQLSRAQLRQVIAAANLDPCFYWMSAPRTPISWDETGLSAVSPHLQEDVRVEPSASQPEGIYTPRAPREPVKSSGQSGSLATTSISTDGPSLEMDGSINYLAFRIQTTNTARRAELAEALRGIGCSLEPSNGRWWLRDRHKTLQFLADSLDEWKSRYGVNMTDRASETIAKISWCRVRAAVTDQDNGHRIVAEIASSDKRPVDPKLIQESIRCGRHYWIDGGQIAIFPAREVERFTAMQRSLEGRHDRGFSPRFEKKVRRDQLPNILDWLTELDADPESIRACKTTAGALRDFSQLQPAPVTTTFDEQLRGYQRIGVAWLWRLHNLGLGGILADEMGLGKTIQALAFLECVLRSSDRPALVVCPAGLIENWRREASRFTPSIKIFVHHGTNRIASPTAAASGMLILTSYGTLTRDQALFQDIQFTTAIVDEGQHLKNRRTQNASAARGLRTDTCFALTGTPIENSLDDLRSLFSITMPGYLSPIPNNLSRDQRQWYDEQHRRQAPPYILRRNKRTVAPELPERLEHAVYCKPTPRQRALYQTFQENSERELYDLVGAGANNGALRMAALTHLLRLRQICVDPRLLDPAAESADSTKLGTLREIIDEAMDDDHRILVFSQFVAALELIAQELQMAGIPYCMLHGKTVNRQSEVDRFQNDPSIPVFLISLKAGGVGLNLTAADTVVHYDPWWNPAVEAQAADRAHRIGQSRTVTVIKLIASETVEEQVITLQQNKSQILRDILDESAAATATISLNEITELIKGGIQ